ncbi:hypothetical protein T4D_14747 [Trichinella pseudospiralis]|uniref:Uncharacterized protein n=1 Tax=Trichinella pseudospiralis TaxID=6337 RepID=A0A0V1G194_TRIPS|nr:hypothetical protein T4D_14747 [Trichinella pseudospiralis]
MPITMMLICNIASLAVKAHVYLNILKMSELYNENHLESMNNIDQNTIHSITSKAHLGIHNNVHSHP